MSFHSNRSARIFLSIAPLMLLSVGAGCGGGDDGTGGAGNAAGAGGSSGKGGAGTGGSSGMSSFMSSPCYAYCLSREAPAVGGKHDCNAQSTIEDCASQDPAVGYTNG